MYEFLLPVKVVGKQGLPSLLTLDLLVYPFDVRVEVFLPFDVFLLEGVVFEHADVVARLLLHLCGLPPEFVSQLLLLLQHALQLAQPNSSHAYCSTNAPSTSNLLILLISYSYCLTIL